MWPTLKNRKWSFLRSTKWVQAILLLGSTLFGLLISPLLSHVLEKTISSTDRAIIAGLVLLTVVVLIGVNASIATHLENARRDERVRGEIDRISRNLGLRGVFLHEGNREPGRDAYSIVRELVEEAQEELLILDHRPALTSDRFYDQTPPEAKSRTKYYEEMTAKALSVTHNGHYFRYKRIVQIEEGPTDTWDTNVNKDKCFADHCRQVVKRRATTPKAVSSIKTSRVFYPNASILIVDSRKVLLELAVVGPDKNTRVEGDLVLVDPGGELAIPLRQLFENIDAQSTLITKVI